MHRRKGEADGDSAPDQIPEEAKVHPKGSNKGLVIMVLAILGVAAILYSYYPSGKAAVSVSGNEKPQVKATTSTNRKDLFTKEDLKRYDGSNPDLPIYLAIIGEVFDVTKGMQHYGPGGGYAFFAGVDGTRAFITGEFNESGLIESVEGLELSQVNDIQGWRDFYHKDYLYKGKLIGHYYDERGRPTANRARFLELLKQHQAKDLVKKNWETKYPGCNSKWSQNEGSEVWCADQSGGITRGWAGVPRAYVGPEHPQRCVCIDERRLGTVDENDFLVYPGCDPLSPLCKT